MEPFIYACKQSTVKKMPYKYFIIQGIEGYYNTKLTVYDGWESDPGIKQGKLRQNNKKFAL